MSSSDLRGELASEITQAVRKLIPSCLTCSHFTEATELCEAATPPARPPAKIIANGCPAYDDIPF